MRALLFKAFLLAGAAIIYMASPFVAAWSIREAVRQGNSAYLQSAIDWPAVRETLKPSLAAFSNNAGFNEGSEQGYSRPGLWQRFKTYVTAKTMEKGIDSLLTPEGLPRLFSMRKAYRDYVSSQPDESQLPVGERLKKAWSRVKRAEFMSLTEFEVEMTDKLDQNRLYLGKLVLTARGWILSELRVKPLNAPINTYGQQELQLTDTLQSAQPRKEKLWTRMKLAARSVFHRAVSSPAYAGVTR